MVKMIENLHANYMVTIQLYLIKRVDFGSMYKCTTARSRIACWHHFEAGKRIVGIFALGTVVYTFFVLREKYLVEKKMKLKSCIKSIEYDTCL